MSNPFQRQGVTSEIDAMQDELQSRPGDHNSDHGSDHENEQRRPTQVDQKQKKQGRPRYRIQPKNLRDPKKGLRLFYGSMGKLKLDQVDNRNETDILNQFLRLYKEWHFNLAAKYDLNYFISRCQDFGREPDIRTYLQRMRSVHIGVNKWEDFADEEEQFAEEEEKKNDQTTQSTQIIPGTQNSGLSLGQLYRPQAGQNGQNNSRPWTNQAYQLNRNSVNNTPNKNAMNMNMNNQHQNQLLSRDTKNQIATTQQSSGMKSSENQRGPTQQEREEYEEQDRILEEERKGQREVAEDDFVDMGDDFDMGGDNFEEPEPDYKDPFDPDDEEPLDEKDLEYPIKKLKI